MLKTPGWQQNGVEPEGEILRHGVEGEAGRFALLRSRGFVHGGGGSEDRAEVASCIRPWGTVRLPGEGCWGVMSSGKRGSSGEAEE